MKMANTEGMIMKYTVIKNKDIEDYLTDDERNTFYNLVEDTIGYTKDVLEARKKQNKYLVINTDEPYADEVIEIMKRNGHWGN